MKFILNISLFFSFIAFDSQSQTIEPDETDSSYQRIKNNPIYMDLIKLSFEHAILKYPDPFRKTEFNAAENLPYGRAAIRNVVPYSKNDRKPIYIKEVCWKLDSSTNITIWYKKDSVEWKPLMNVPWIKGTSF